MKFKEMLSDVVNEWNVANEHKHIGNIVNPFSGKNVLIPKPTVMDKPPILI